MSDIHPHIATCNHMAQFQENGTWMPVNVSGECILTPSGLAIAVKKPVVLRALSSEEIHEEMKLHGDIYVENFYAQN